MRSLKFTALVATVGLLAGCSFQGLADRVNPYRIDVRQGNYVDQDMVSRLKKGMTRDQVRFALGTPLLVDAFHDDRWEYVYVFKPGRGELQKRAITVFFVDDRLDHVAGDVQTGGAQGGSVAAERTRVIEIEPAQKK